MKFLPLPLAILVALNSSVFAEENRSSSAEKSARQFHTPEQDRKTLDAKVESKTGLPNVLILGDSISIGYTQAVRKGLEGKANVVRPKANCGDTPRGLDGIDKWLGDNNWDVIHFNWGLWDLCYRNPDSKQQGNRDKINGTLSVPMPEYEANLDKLVTRLKQTGATLIWASTTYVPEGEVGRRVGDEIKYNAAAAKVMEKHGVAINDLHATSAAFAPEMFVKPGNVHYTKKGSSKLAEQVVAVISETLEETGRSGQIIDCHVHLYSLTRPDGITWIKPDNKHLYKDHLPEDFKAVAEANGVTGVVLVQAGQSLPDNRWNLEISEPHKDLFRGVIGNLSTVIGNKKFAPMFKRLCEDPRYLGYRLSGRYGDELTDDFFRDLETTAKAGKSVDFLLGGDWTLKDVATVAERVPELRIIVDHLGGIRLDGKPLDPEWVEDFKAVAKHPNVYCKVSALFGRVAEQPAPTDPAFYKPVMDLAFESFGEDRLVYGSDWPVTKTTAEYAAVLELTRAYFDAKGPEASEKLFHQNAEKFYKVPPVK